MRGLCQDARGVKPQPPTDAELVARALAGDQEAFRQLVLRFERPVLSVISRLIRDPAAAEDVAQEAFVKAFRHLHRYDPQWRLASWLFKIAHNTAIDHLRRRRPETVPLEAPDADGEGRWERFHAPEQEGPEEQAASTELAAAVDQALGGLREQYREILELRFQQGLSYEEIAEVMGLALGTVKVQLHRARKQLADRLRERGFHVPEGST